MVIFSIQDCYWKYVLQMYNSLGYFHEKLQKITEILNVISNDKNLTSDMLVTQDYEVQVYFFDQ